MNRKFFTPLLISLLALCAACGNSSSERQPEEVFLEDKQGKTGEVFIDESNFQEKQTFVSHAAENSRGETRLLADGSRIVTMFDGFGNKTETRFFEGDARLTQVILRTSANGQRQVTVYGHGTDVKTVNQLGERAMTIAGEEIANVAGMYATQTRREVKNYMKGSVNPDLKPSPSAEFPVAGQTTESPTPETSETENIENKPPDEPQSSNPEENPQR